MSLTQRYKQQKQQVRVMTNEGNYLKGMFYTDFPLTEGYVRTLINLDIDTMSGKLTPRKGLRSLGIIKPTEESKEFLNNETGYNVVVNSKVCSTADSTDPRKINKSLQSIVYNTYTDKLVVTSTDADITENSTFTTIPFSTNSDEEYVVSGVYAINNPEVHGKPMIRDVFFKKPVGTFAYNNQYFTFLRQNEYSLTELTAPSGFDVFDFLCKSGYATGQRGQYYPATLPLELWQSEEDVWVYRRSVDSFGPNQYTSIETSWYIWVGCAINFSTGVADVTNWDIVLGVTPDAPDAKHKQLTLVGTSSTTWLWPHPELPESQINYSWSFGAGTITIGALLNEGGYRNFPLQSGVMYTKNGDEYTTAPEELISLLCYYDTNGNRGLWAAAAIDALTDRLAVYKNYTLTYTKSGVDLQDTDVLLDARYRDQATLNPDAYYVCKIEPEKNNPSEAASWGYNMLLDNPYDFVCEETATNNITILGIIPYDEDGHPVLTPKKNQTITLKGFYRAPSAFHSDNENAKYYATTKHRLTIYFETEDETPSVLKTYYILDDEQYVAVQVSTFDPEVTYYEKIERDPKNKAEIEGQSGYTLDDYTYGDWWYCTDEQLYYMVMPQVASGQTTASKALLKFGATKPAASEKLNPLNSAEEDTIRVRWQIRTNGASDWTDMQDPDDQVFKLSDYYHDHGNFAPFTITKTIPENEVIIRLIITDPNDTTTVGGVSEEYTLSANTIGLSLVSDELANTLNLDAKNFELGKATGMCEWGQRLVLWGVPEALNTLFISDVNNPGFFPYPNNIDVFPDPIIAAYNYGTELLVLTASALYRLAWDLEGTGWTHTLVQQNLHITETDRYAACVIKNMFFFKSGEFYYMMVPKVSTKTGIRGEVAIAPISKPIEGLLNNFHEEIYKLVRVLSDDYTIGDFTNKFINYFSYVDNAKVVVNYVYALDAVTAMTSKESKTDSEYLYVQLIYDTELRAWSMRLFEAPHMLYASHADAIQQDRFIDITPSDVDKLVLQYYKFTEISDYAVQYIDTEDKAVVSTPKVKNYQYLDTGNREINTELKKRFREFQFKLHNKTATNLGFFTSFLIDGSLRKDLQRYTPRFISDPLTDEQLIVVERTLDNNSLVGLMNRQLTYHTTRIERILIPSRMLQDNGELTPTIIAEENDPDRWILNQSAFPGRTLWKIRMPISGKGYSPRAILLSTNEKEYELYGDCWVYRTMNGR